MCLMIRFVCISMVNWIGLIDFDLNCERERRSSGSGGFQSIGGGAADSETWGKKKGEEIRGSLSDLSNLTNTSLYGFEDYHGVDLGVVRLWYAPLAGEVPIEIKLKEDDSKLGFAISRTDEGFIFISSVIDDDKNAPSTRSGSRESNKGI